MGQPLDGLNRGQPNQGTVNQLRGFGLRFWSKPGIMRPTFAKSCHLTWLFPFLLSYSMTCVTVQTATLHLLEAGFPQQLLQL